MVLQNDDSQLNETVQNEKPVYESALKYLAENSGLRRNRPGTSNLVSIYWRVVERLKLIICFYKEFYKWKDENFEEIESILAVQQVKSKFLLNLYIL